MNPATATPMTAAAKPTTLSELLLSLEDLHGDGEAQWLALCPAHDDSSPSLRVALGEPRDDDEYGPVLLHCRANCDKDAVLSALSLTRRDLASMMVDEDCWDVPVDTGKVRKGRKAVGTALYAPITAAAQRELEADIELRAARLWDDAAGHVPGQITAADARAYVKRRWGLDEEQMRYLRLGFEDYRGQYGRRDRGVFVPFSGVRQTADGTYELSGAMGFQVRHMNADTRMKWATPAAPGAGDFGWSRIGIFALPPRSDEESLLPVLVTEGPGDALTAASLGFPAIAIRGASLARNAEVQEEVAAAVRLLAAQRDIDPTVIVCGDGDDAGRAFAADMRAALLRRRLVVSELTLADGEDLTSLRECGAVSAADDILALEVAAPDLPVEWTDLDVPVAELADALPAEVLHVLGVSRPGAPAPEVVAPISSSHATAVNALSNAFGQLDLDPWAQDHTDLGAARLLQQALVQLGTPARHCPQKGGWLVYDPTRGIWTVDASKRLHAVAHRAADHLAGKARAARTAAEALDEGLQKAKAEKTAEAVKQLSHRFQSTRMTNAMLSQLESILVAAPAEFDGEETRHLLVVGNGVVNLRSGELMPFDAGLMMTVGTEIAFDSAASAPQWGAFIRRASVAAPDEMPVYLQSLAGLMATGFTEQNVHFLLGEGANGKGVWLNVIEEILAGSIVATGAGAFEDASRGEGPTPMLAALEPARGVIVDELKAKQTLDDGRLKALSGDSTITTRRLHQEPHSWRPRFTMVVATNHPPRFPGDAPDYGIRRRVRVVPFLMKLAADEQDPRIVEKLLSESEGILAWIVAGARRYFAEGLTCPSFVEEASADMWSATNPLADLLEGEASPFVLDSNATLDRTTAFESYVEWARATGQPGIWSRQRFYNALPGFGVTTKKSNGKRVLVGIGLSGTAPAPTPF